VINRRRKLSVRSKGEAGGLERWTQVKREGRTAESEARSAVQADDAAEDEAGRLDAGGASRSPGRTAEREAQPAVQAVGGDEREADRLGGRRKLEARSGSRSGRRDCLESRGLESEGWSRELA